MFSGLRKTSPTARTCPALRPGCARFSARPPGNCAGKAPQSADQGGIDGGPRFLRSAVDGAGIPRGPNARAVAMRAGPGADLVDAQAGRRQVVAHPPLLRQQPGQRRAGWQPTAPVAQGRIHDRPGFPARPCNRSGVALGPGAGPAVVGVRPGQNLFAPQSGKSQVVARPPPPGEQAGQGRAARQPALAVGQGNLDGHPRFPGCFEDGAARDFRPPARAPVMRIRPGQNLLHRQRGRVLRVADAAVFGQQAGEGRTARQTTVALAQVAIHGVPGFLRRLVDPTGGPRRPGARALVVGIGPGQDLADGQPRQTALVADPALLGQQLGQGGPTRQPAQALAQRHVQVDPLLIGRPEDPLHLLLGPLSGPFVVGIGPGENLRQVDHRPAHRLGARSFATPRPSAQLPGHGTHPSCCCRSARRWPGRGRDPCPRSAGWLPCRFPCTGDARPLSYNHPLPDV
jgi:hypothetical protein